MKNRKLEDIDKTVIEMVFDTDGNDPSISIKFHSKVIAYDGYDYNYIQTYKFRENGSQFEYDMYCVLSIFTYTDVILGIIELVSDFTTSQKYILAEFILQNIRITTVATYDKLGIRTGFVSEVSIYNDLRDALSYITKTYNNLSELDKLGALLASNITNIYFRNDKIGIYDIDINTIETIKGLLIKEYTNEANWIGYC